LQDRSPSRTNIGGAIPLCTFTTPSFFDVFRPSLATSRPEPTWHHSSCSRYDKMTTQVVTSIIPAGPLLSSLATKSKLKWTTTFRIYHIVLWARSKSNYSQATPDMNELVIGMRCDPLLETLNSPKKSLLTPHLKTTASPTPESPAASGTYEPDFAPEPNPTTISAPSTFACGTAATRTTRNDTSTTPPMP